MDLGLRERVALVGGTSRGIGRAVAGRIEGGAPGPAGARRASGGAGRLRDGDHEGVAA